MSLHNVMFSGARGRSGGLKHKLCKKAVGQEAVMFVMRSDCNPDLRYRSGRVEGRQWVKAVRERRLQSVSLEDWLDIFYINEEK